MAKKEEGITEEREGTGQQLITESESTEKVGKDAGSSQSIDSAEDRGNGVDQGNISGSQQEKEQEEKKEATGEKGASRSEEALAQEGKMSLDEMFELDDDQLTQYLTTDQQNAKNAIKAATQRNQQTAEARNEVDQRAQQLEAKEQQLAQMQQQMQALMQQFQGGQQPYGQAQPAPGQSLGYGDYDNDDPTARQIQQMQAKIDQMNQNMQMVSMDAMTQQVNQQLARAYSDYDANAVIDTINKLDQRGLHEVVHKALKLDRLDLDGIRKKAYVEGSRKTIDRLREEQDRQKKSKAAPTAPMVGASAGTEGKRKPRSFEEVKEAPRQGFFDEV